jgi:hypothetical protein
VIHEPQVAPDETRHQSTLPPPPDLRSIRRGRFGRRVFTVVLVVFLGLGLLGMYGVRTGSTEARGGGYEITVTYTKITRPGLATPWSVEIRHPGGFGEETITVATLSSYFDAFDENGLDPDPAQSTSDGERSIWKFDPPPGDVMTVSLDARIEPGVQLTRLKGEVSVLDPSGADVVTARFRTVVLP